MKTKHPSPSHRPPFALALALALALVSACAPRQTQEPAVQGPAFIVEVANTMPHAMNVSFAIGDEITALGTVNAGETKRWTIPNRGSDAIRLIARDANGSHSVDESMDLDAGVVKRWEIK